MTKFRVGLINIKVLEAKASCISVLCGLERFNTGLGRMAGFLTRRLAPFSGPYCEDRAKSILYTRAPYSLSSHVRKALKP